jgi:hypothetical protein
MRPRQCCGYCKAILRISLGPTLSGDSGSHVRSTQDPFAEGSPRKRATSMSDSPVQLGVAPSCSLGAGYHCCRGRRGRRAGTQCDRVGFLSSPGTFPITMIEGRLGSSTQPRAHRKLPLMPTKLMFDSLQSIALTHGLLPYDRHDQNICLDHRVRPSRWVC